MAECPYGTECRAVCALFDRDEGCCGILSGPRRLGLAIESLSAALERLASSGGGKPPKAKEKK